MKWIFLQQGLGKFIWLYSAPSSIVFMLFKNVIICFLGLHLDFFPPVSLCCFYLVQFWFPFQQFLLSVVPILEGEPEGSVLRAEKCFLLQVVQSVLGARVFPKNCSQFQLLFLHGLFLSEYLLAILVSVPRLLRHSLPCRFPPLPSAERQRSCSFKAVVVCSYTVYFGFMGITIHLVLF